MKNNKYGIRISLDYDFDTYRVGELDFKAMLCTISSLCFCVPVCVSVNMITQKLVFVYFYVSTLFLLNKICSV